MYNELMFLGAIVSFLLIGGAVVGLLDRKNFEPRWLLIAALIFILNDVMLTNGLYQLHNFIPSNEWNWQGKILALLSTLAVAALPAFGWRRVGLTLAQNRLSLKACIPAIMIYVAYVLVLAFIFPNDSPSAETVAFQLTMPGLEESPFFLGIFLFALDQAFRGRVTLRGVKLGWAVLLASLVFGLVHALSYSEGRFHFDALNMILTSAPSILVFWIRERTGSLLLPVILHNFGNTLTLFV